MADLSYVQVAADSSGKRLRTTIVEDASTVHQEIMVVAGGTGDIWDPTLNAIPSSSAVAMPMRVVTTTTSVVLGSVALLEGSSANDLGVHLLSTGFGTAAIDPRQVTVIAGTSGAGIGTIQSTAFGSAAIDPRQVTVVGGTSGAYISVLNATAQGAVTIDPRQATIVGGTSGAGIGTIVSTGVGGAAIDPRAITQASTWDVKVVGAGSSGVLGTVLSATGLGASAIDPRQVTVVAGTSGAYISVLNATAQGSATIDPRQATIVGGTSGAGIGTILSTGFGQAAIDPRILGANSSGVLVGAVVVSTAAGGLRMFDDSTTVVSQRFYYTTGTVIPSAASTVLSLAAVVNMSSSATATSFNVAAGKLFRVEFINVSLRATSGTSLWCDFALRATTSTAGTTGTTPPIWYQRIATAQGTTAALPGGADAIAVTDLTIDLPSSASFGMTVQANSSLSGEIMASFGGIEFTI